MSKRRIYWKKWSSSFKKFHKYITKAGQGIAPLAGFPLYKLQLSQVSRPLSGIKLIIIAFFRNQLIVGTAFGNSLVGNIHDLIAILDGREPVRNDKGSPSLQQLVQGGLNHPFRFGVNRRGRLIQIRIFGSANSVLAKEISCLWPCDNREPRSLTSVR